MTPLDNIDDGGTAFPTTKPLEHWGDPNRGMSLRDFAEVHFIAALIASPRSPAGAGEEISAEEYIQLGKITARIWLAARKEKP